MLGSGAGLAVVAALLAAVLSLLRRRRPLPPGSPAKTMIVLGSGGHTTEMLRLTSKLSPARYAPVWFVVAATDTTSAQKAEATPHALTPTHWATIPRAREVGQSFTSSVATTLRAALAAAALVVRVRPDLVIANGPGTCVPICVVAHLLGARIIFCESWCRVETLSLTGRILYPIADRFVVHWPKLRLKYPRAEYIGRIC
ncbi:oligosaccharide biosynthesis protein Alg14-like protein [Pelagophyceae sp. CCMP2097]|nr:oligosaccharide biosynthesis protein Alg14-like protein [Pelagophyceae sp. CCMP2097]